MASIINTGISALNAFKRQLETTGHNIANVNTSGFKKSRADFEDLLYRLSTQFINLHSDKVDWEIENALKSCFISGMINKRLPFDTSWLFPYYTYS